MSAAPGGMSGDDASLTEALDSFDQLTLQRDRQRRRVTEEENAVRCLEELLAEKQRELEQLERESNSRADELAALERRVPALEDTQRGARRSLQMLTQMRDLLSKQLADEKQRTEQMLKKLDAELEETQARWVKYEAIYLTMPVYQRKLEADALAAEERQLTEKNRELEAELKSRVSDRDFCVQLAENWTQMRLLESVLAGGGGSGGGRQSPDGEGLSSACSQGFSTPQASLAPSPISDMETGQELDGARSHPETARDDCDTAVYPPGQGQRPPENLSQPRVAGSGDQTLHPVDGVGAPTRPGWGAEAGPGTPQKRPPPPPQPVQVQQVQTSGPPARLGSQSPFLVGAMPQHQHSSQRQPQSAGRPQPPQQTTASQQSHTQTGLPPQTPTPSGPASRAAPSPEKAGWSSTEPRHDPAPSPRRAGSFLIQMPSLYRPSRPRPEGTAGGDTQVSYRPVASAPHAPPPILTPPECRPPPPPPPTPPPSTRLQQQHHQQQQQQQQQPPPPTPPPPPAPPASQAQQWQQPSPQRHQPSPPQAATAAAPFAARGTGAASPQQDVEMTDVQEIRQSPARPWQLDGQSRTDAAESSPKKSGGRPPQYGRIPGEFSPGRQPISAEERPPEPQTADQPQPPVSVERGVPAQTPPGQSMLAGRQYWLPMPSGTPDAPPLDERRSFVQQLRQSPELARRTPPHARPAAAPPSGLGPGLDHQFLRPAVPSRRRSAPAPGPSPVPTSPQSIFDTPRRSMVEPPASPQRPTVGSPSGTPLQPAPPSTPRAPVPTAPSEPSTPVQPPPSAGDAPRSMVNMFASPEASQLDTSSFSLFGGAGGKEASPQPPPPSTMSLFGAGDVGGDGDQGADDFSLSFFGGGPKETDKEASGGGGGGGGIFSSFF